MTRPIIFSAPMVKALLDGRKTQTRRILKPQPVPCLSWSEPPPGTYPSAAGWSRFPYAPGDRLWVKEAFRGAKGYDGLPPSKWGNKPIWYAADGQPGEEWWHLSQRNRSPIHMPRWASRLTLTVTDVRVQRLQDISEADAKAEGIEQSQRVEKDGGRHFVVSGVSCIDELTAAKAFRRLWNSIHGPDAWDANPWVVALTFTVQQRNIDA